MKRINCYTITIIIILYVSEIVNCHETTSNHKAIKQKQNGTKKSLFESKNADIVTRQNTQPGAKSSDTEKNTELRDLRPSNKIEFIKHDIGKKLMDSLSGELTRREFEKEDSEFEQKLQKEQEAKKEEEKAFNQTNLRLDRLGMLRSSMSSVVDEKTKLNKEKQQQLLNIDHLAHNRSITAPNRTMTKKTTGKTFDNEKLIHNLRLNLTTEHEERTDLKYAKKKAEPPFKVLNLNLTVERDTTNLTKQDPELSTPTEVYDKIFLNQVIGETHKKEKSGHKDILPVYTKPQTDSTTMENKWKLLEDKYLKSAKILTSKINQNGILTAEYIDEKPEHKNHTQSEVSNTNKSTNNISSSMVSHLTTGVLTPADIEKTSKEFSSASTSSIVKKPIRIRLNQVDNRKKMFFAKQPIVGQQTQNKHNSDNNSEDKSRSRVTVFGADDIDLETSTPRILVNSENSESKQSSGVKEYAANENNKLNPKERENIERLRTMEAELKTTRAKLHFRGFIPRRPVALSP